MINQLLMIKKTIESEWLKCFKSGINKLLNVRNLTAKLVFSNCNWAHFWMTFRSWKVVLRSSQWRGSTLTVSGSLWSFSSCWRRQTMFWSPSHFFFAAWSSSSFSWFNFYTKHWIQILIYFFLRVLDQIVSLMIVFIVEKWQVATLRTDSDETPILFLSLFLSRNIRRIFFEKSMFSLITRSVKKLPNEKLVKDIV